MVADAMNGAKTWKLGCCLLLTMLSVGIVLGGYAFLAAVLLDEFSGRPRTWVKYIAEYDGFILAANDERLKFDSVIVTHPSTAAKDFEITMPGGVVVSLADIERDNSLIPREVLGMRTSDSGVFFYFDQFDKRLDVTSFNFTVSTSALPLSYKGKRFKVPMTQSEMEQAFGTRYRLKAEKAGRGAP